MSADAVPSAVPAVSLTRATVLAAIARFRPVPVQVPALGGTVYVRPLSVAGMAKVHAATITDPTTGKSRMDPERGPALMVIDCVVDSDGGRIFTEAQERLVADLPGNAIAPLLAAIERVSDLGAAASDAAAGN